MEETKKKYEIHIFHHRHKQITVESRWDESNQFAIRDVAKNLQRLIDGVVNTLKAVDKFGMEIIVEGGNVDFERIQAEKFDPAEHELDYVILNHPDIIARSLADAPKKKKKR